MKKVWMFISAVLILWLPAAEHSAAHVFETFNSETSTEGFQSSGYWSISGGAFHYNNPAPQAGYFTWVPWNGGNNSGGWAPSLTESNYFYEFSVSVTANGENGSGDKFYGLYVGGQKNSSDQTSIILFRINGDGSYRVSELKDDEWGLSTGDVKSTAITGQNDRLTILKQGDLFRFFINYTEVEFLKIDGHFGGSAGLTSDLGARPSFDNFEIVDLAEIQPDFNSESEILNIPLLDVLNAGGASGAYETSLKLNSVNPVSFDLVEIDAYQASGGLFSWYDIFDRISMSPYRPSFDFNDNIMQIPSVRLDDGAGGATLLQVDLKLRPTDDVARFELDAVNEYTPDCSVVDQNRWLYDRMMDVYYWYNQLPTIDYASYSSTEDLLEALKYKELDKWSYITTRAAHSSLFEKGTYIGVGFGTRYDSENNLRISHVYQESPADRAGVKRGWKLLRINGKTVEEIENNNLWSDIYGEDNVGVVVELKFEDLQDRAMEISLVKDLVRINTVFYYDTFNIGNKKVGHLVFMKFLETSEEELNTVFSYFKQREVDEMILDLRYNDGGRGYIANYLAGLISGDNTDGRIFAKLNRNDKHQDQNYDYIFEKQDNSLNLSRLIVITGYSTCSASELVINGLKPFMDVVTIGRATCGKPVGMNGQYFCDKILTPIVFETRNANDEGGYFEGIEANCAASDDLTSAFGDLNESSLKEALYYLENGRCSCSARSGALLSASSPREQHISGLRRIIGAF